MMCVQSLTPEGSKDKYSLIFKSMICDITSHLEPILVQYSGYTNEMWKLEAFDVQKHWMDVTVKEETSCVLQEKP